MYRNKGHSVSDSKYFMTAQNDQSLLKLNLLFLRFLPVRICFGFHAVERKGGILWDQMRVDFAYSTLPIELDRRTNTF